MALLARECLLTIGGGLRGLCGGHALACCADMANFQKAKLQQLRAVAVGLLVVCAMPAQDAAKAVRVAPQIAPATAKPRLPVAKIGVVDLDKAIDQYATATRERDRLQALSQQYNDELDGLTQRIDEVRGQMSVLKEGSMAYEDKEFELAGLVQARERLATLRKRQFDRQLEEFELAVYEDIEYAIAQVASDRGIAVVLRVQHSLDLSPENSEIEGAQKAKLMQFNRRTVWYTSAEVDMTPHLIKYLQVFDPRAERAKAAEGAATKGGVGDGEDGGK